MTRDEVTASFDSNSHAQQVALHLHDAIDSLHQRLAKVEKKSRIKPGDNPAEQTSDAEPETED